MHLLKNGLRAAILCLSVAAASGCSRNEPLYTAKEAEETAGQSLCSPDTEAFVSANEAVMPVQTDPPGYVYVCGAVRSPGVYEISGDMRVRDAIEAAGWFSEAADQEWLNQAEKICDGQRIYVYTHEETQKLKDAGISIEEGGNVLPAEKNGEEAVESGKININTATREELMTLPGIGEAKADAILKYRSEVGSFSSIEEIQNISGIKSGVFSKIQDQITV